MKRIVVGLVIGMVTSLSLGQAQASPPTAPATALPDISVVINAKADYGWDRDSQPVTDNILAPASAKIDEAELNIESAIFPNVKARVVIAYSGDSGASVEEAYANALAIADILGLKLGRTRIGFGKLNPLHPHAWPFADTPPVFSNFIGELKGDGADLSVILPLPFFLQIDVGGYRYLGSDDEAEFGLRGFGNLGRLWTSFGFGIDGELELGVSGLYAKGPVKDFADDVLIGGTDLTLRLYPSAGSRLIWQSEGLLFRRVAGRGPTEDELASDPAAPNKTESLLRWGLYSYLGYRFDKTWELGARFDRTQGNDWADAGRTNQLSAIATCNLTELTLLRLQYTHGFEKSSHQFTFQFVFGMGPHTHPLN